MPHRTSPNTAAGFNTALAASVSSHPLAEHTRREFHDLTLVELERHSPEGVEAHGVPRWAWRLAAAACVALVGAGLALLWALAGPPAAALGAVIVVALYAVGVLPEWAAARVRHREMRRFERRIDAKIARLERRAGRNSGGAPVGA